MMNRFSIWIFTLVCALPLALAPALAEDGKLKKEELDQLLAPIALYPDDVLANVLMASTYPLDVVQAARWRKNPENAKLKGDALTKALEAKDWDPSIKALVQFPDVLEQMSDQLEWTQKLGDAFLAQQDQVMDEIQFLRQKADATGSLKSNKQQRVTKETGPEAQPIYVIEPADPETVYVPVYEPEVVYGEWWYPDYPPYYWPYPDARYVNGFFWGAGVAIAAAIWGWNRFDWRHKDIDIDVNKWNNINVNRGRITSSKWEHRPDQRGAVPYRDKATREKFGQADRRPAGSKEFRGHDRGDIDRAAIEAKLKATDHSQVKDKIGEKRADKVRDKAGDGAGAKIKDKAGDRRKGGGEKVSRDVDRRKAKKPTSGAFDVKRGADVRKSANRGHASRVAMGGGRAHVGGRGGPRGGGGFRGGGGRRR